MKVLVLQGKNTAFTKPTLPKDLRKTDKMAWGKDYNVYLTGIERYKMDKAKVFARICGYCTELMKNWPEKWTYTRKQIRIEMWLHFSNYLKKWYLMPATRNAHNYK